MCKAPYAKILRGAFLPSSSQRPKVSFFVSCLVDQFFPQVGESAVRVLQRLGVDVYFPKDQTCCGQPAYNSGFQKEAKALAKRFLKIFTGSDYIVVPSGSCGGMVRVFYPHLFQDDPLLYEQAKALSSRVYEFSEFLVKVLGVTDVGAARQCKVTYHDSCHLRRELNVVSEPRALIQGVKGAEFVEMEQAEVCCGFGGSFAVKYADISGAILKDKVRYIKDSGAEILIANDSGCLMHMAGALEREGASVKAMHLAQFLDQDMKGYDDARAPNQAETA